MHELRESPNNLDATEQLLPTPDSLRPLEGQELLDQLLATTTEGHWLLDAQGRTTYVSPRASELLGRSEAELLGLPLLTVVAEGSRDEAHAMLEERALGRIEREICFQRGDSQAVWARLSLSPRLGRQGGYLGAFATLTDITELRQAKEALHSSERRFRALVDRLPDAVCVFRNERFAYVNPALAACLGYVNAEELIGQPCLERVAPEARTSLEQALGLAQGRRSQPPRSNEMQLMRRDGSRVEVEGMVLPMPFDGEPATLAVWRDVTEQRQLAARMLQLDRMSAVGTLAAGVAHEINNPLAYVIANLEYAVGQLSAPEQLQDTREALSDALEGAARVRAIVRDLKMFSRSEDEAPGPVELPQVIESAISMAQNEVRHRAQLVRQLGPVPPVLANEGKLSQVFLNLLVNAAHAIAEGAADRNQIQVSTRPGAPGTVVVEVRDTGSGIPREILGRIFDPFFTTKPVGVGTGLGLSICQDIVTSYGGTIGVTSEVGQGTTFQVVLKVAESVEQPPQAPLEAPRPLARRGRLLVVDDESMVLQAIHRALGHEHELVLVDHARQAVELLQQGERFDLILCDLMMPETTGADLYQQVLPLWPDQARAFVFLTGGAFTPGVRLFLEHTLNPRIDKPFRTGALQGLIRELLAQSPTVARY